MSQKQNIVNKIKSIEDSKILGKLEQWLDEVCNAGVQEERETYVAKTVGAKKEDSESNALKWLQKVADEGGVSAIKNPVEWQKKDRKDRSLPMQ